MKSDNVQSILRVKIQLKTKGCPENIEQLKVFCWRDLECLGKKEFWIIGVAQKLVSNNQNTISATLFSFSHSFCTFS